MALRIEDWRRREVPANADVLRAVVAPPKREDAEKRTTSYYAVERELEPLWLVRRALEADPYNTGAWAAIETLGQRGLIPPAELARLLDKLAVLTGTDYPDVLYFALLAHHSNLPPEDERRFIESARKGLTQLQVERAPEMLADLFLLAGDVYAAEGKLASALEQYRKSLAVDWEYPPVVIRAVERALPIAKETGDLDYFGRACKRIFDRTRDPKYGLEIGRLIAEAGLHERAVVWLRDVYDRGEYDRPGRFGSLRLAIAMLTQMEKYETAVLWSSELYEATEHPADGYRIVALLRAMGKDDKADQVERRVEAKERARLEEVERDAERRSGLGP